jgi:twinkle protein
VKLFWPGENGEPGYRLPFRKVADKVLFRPGRDDLVDRLGRVGEEPDPLALLRRLRPAGRADLHRLLEMAPVQTLRRMVKQATNVDRPTEAFIREAMGWLDGWLWMFALVGKSQAGRILEVFEYARCRYGCDVFVIDSLMRLGIGSEDYEGQERAIFEIVSWAIERRRPRPPRRPRQEGRARFDRAGDRGHQGRPGDRRQRLQHPRHLAQPEAGGRAPHAHRGGREGRPGGAAQLGDLADKPGVVVNVPKQRNGDWEGKFGLWFSTATYQYRSSHDEASGREFVGGRDWRGEAA